VRCSHLWTCWQTTTECRRRLRCVTDTASYSRQIYQKHYCNYRPTASWRCRTVTRPNNAGKICVETRKRARASKYRDTVVSREPTAAEICSWLLQRCNRSHYSYCVRCRTLARWSETGVVTGEKDAITFDERRWRRKRSRPHGRRAPDVTQPGQHHPNPMPGLRARRWRWPVHRTSWMLAGHCRLARASWRSAAAAQVPLAAGDEEAKYVRRQQIRHITTDPALRRWHFGGT